jgi:hypothetical protein
VVVDDGLPRRRRLRGALTPAIGNEPSAAGEDFLRDDAELASAGLIDTGLEPRRKRSRL